MSIKSQLITLLEKNRETYISGDKLAKELSVSRNAIWKAVESLREEGYEISAVTNRGYLLTDSGDSLSEAGIVAHIKSDSVFHIDVRNSVTSTNTLLRELAARGAPEGYVVAAEEQTSGKGRFGRAFYSPAGHGVYFSFLLRPGPQAADAALITSAAGVATARAIGEIMCIYVGIKWVNDLLLNEKKICGILTEATLDMESGLIESAVLGIGVNITRPPDGYPESVEDVATALSDRRSGKDGERRRLIAAILDRFWVFYRELTARKFLEDYRERSILLGRDIYVFSHDGKRPARALEIDDDCRLVVRYVNGEIAVLNSGEVSIRCAEE